VFNITLVLEHSPFNGYLGSIPGLKWQSVVINHSPPFSATNKYEQRRGVYRVLVGNHEGKNPFGKPRHRWEDHIKMDIQEVGCGDTFWIEFAEDRQVAGTCECCNEPSDSKKCGEFLD
jgi:hypothetical protein